MRLPLALCLCGVMIACAGPSLSTHGRSHTPATFSAGGLRANLPRQFDAMTVVAAGEAALIDRGYVIVKKQGTEGRMVIHAGTPAVGRPRHTARMVVFRAIQQNRGVGVEIFVDPFSNKAESRAILDSTLARLGR